VKEIGDKFIDLTRRLGELTGRIDAFVAGISEPRGRSFRFAPEGSEPEGAVDLPNPIRPRGRALNS
jgi:hypothetical protein